MIKKQKHTIQSWRQGRIHNPALKKELTSKLHRPYTGPYLVVKKTQTNLHVVDCRNKDGNTMIVHANRCSKAETEEEKPRYELRKNPTPTIKYLAAITLCLMISGIKAMEIQQELLIGNNRLVFIITYGKITVKTVDPLKSEYTLTFLSRTDLDSNIEMVYTQMEDVTINNTCVNHMNGTECTKILKNLTAHSKYIIRRKEVSNVIHVCSR